MSITTLESESIMIEAALNKEENEIVRIEDAWNDFYEQNEHLIKNDSIIENSEEYLMMESENEEIFTNKSCLNIHKLDVNNDRHFSLLAQHYCDLQSELTMIESLLMQGEHDMSA